MFVGLPGVLWVLPDSYIDVKNKDYGGYFLVSTLVNCVLDVILVANVVAKCLLLFGFR